MSERAFLGAALHALHVTGDPGGVSEMLAVACRRLQPAKGPGVWDLGKERLDVAVGSGHDKAEDALVGLGLMTRNDGEGRAYATDTSFAYKGRPAAEKGSRLSLPWPYLAQGRLADSRFVEARSTLLDGLAADLHAVIRGEPFPSVALVGGSHADNAVAWGIAGNLAAARAHTGEPSSELAGMGPLMDAAVESKLEFISRGFGWGKRPGTDQAARLGARILAACLVRHAAVTAAALLGTPVRTFPASFPLDIGASLPRVDS